MTKIQDQQKMAEKFAIILAPYAPHIAEELWERFGHSEGITFAEWATWTSLFS